MCIIALNTSVVAAAGKSELFLVMNHLEVHCLLPQDRRAPFSVILCHNLNLMEKEKVLWLQNV